MNTDEFSAIAEKMISSRPGWFLSTEGPLSISEVSAEVRKLGIDVPEDLVYFSTRFGAGYFDAINVSSFAPRSRWYRWDSPVVLSSGKQLVVVSDDESGGVYGFIVVDGKCSKEVYYADLERSRPAPEKVAETFLDFVANTAFQFD